MPVLQTETLLISAGHSDTDPGAEMVPCQESSLLDYETGSLPTLTVELAVGWAGLRVYDAPPDGDD